MTLPQNRPDITIVIPARNVASFVSTALRSALAQQDVTIEVVIVNDGSTDNTAEQIAAFADDVRLRVIHQENQGVPAARNTGLRAASGRYVGFLDCDDIWAPQKAARHVALLDSNPAIDLTYSWWSVIDEAGGETGRINKIPASRVPGGLTFEGLVIENFAGNGSTVVCRPEALRQAGSFDPALRHSSEDLDAWLRIAALRNDNIGLVPEVLTSYRVRDGQMTGDLHRMLFGWEAAIEKARRQNPVRVARVEPEARARMNRFLSYIAYQNGEYAAARSMLLRAWCSAPRALLHDVRAWPVTCAVLAQMLLPSGWHTRLVDTAKALRVRAVRSGLSDV